MNQPQPPTRQISVGQVIIGLVVLVVIAAIAYYAISGGGGRGNNE